MPAVYCQNFLSLALLVCIATKKPNRIHYDDVKRGIKLIEQLRKLGASFLHYHSMFRC